MAGEEAQNPATNEGKSGGLLPKILIGVAVIALQAAISFVLVKKFSAPPPAPTAVEEVKAEKSEEKVAFGDVYLLEDVIVNPAGSKGRKFLNATVALVYSGKVGAELEKRDVQLRDTMLKVLGSYTTDQLADPAFRDSLRSAIKTEVNKILTTGEVSAVYFAAFVMQ